ncbi:MAG: ATP-binding protein [Cyclobacteriaceae bacterium]|nr:ATP-binding protein [Cyclobacteriaceae bacterium]MCB0498441.1 ATP-binding protein [Cyclobacteriaceae bacterium]MCB9236989.1 ATP-binding protein [Flammeovirgaceae bacterium]MCO5271635.1 ATP-binding protein [Cyclobacteriaceae bacterium]MCW5901301.1 ATP-binding protein [Cyclobacteriaceae bacterium]
MVARNTTTLGKLMLRLVFVVFFSGAVTIPPLWAQQFSLRQYTAVDGLPQSQVNMMVEDKEGYLWIATNGGGLARFDGNEFKVYTTRDGLSSNIVQYLKLDSRQNLWIINPVGITRYNGLDFKRFIPQGLHAKLSIRRVFEVNDTVFFVNSQRALGKIFNDSVYYWNKPVKDKRLILYTHLMPNKEICLYLNDSSFMIKSPLGTYSLNHAKDFSFALSIFNYGKEVWINTEKGYFSIDTQRRKFVKRVMDIENQVIQYDSLNDVYWTRYGDDLLMERKRGKAHQVDTILRGVNINQILPDSEGNTWLGTTGSGLYKFYVKDFDRYGHQLYGSVLSLVKGKEGEFWIGTLNKGIWKYADGATKHYSGAVSEVNQIRMGRDGSIWVGSYSGLGRYNAARDRFDWFTREDGIASAYINSLDIDQQGNVWYGTRANGVGYFNGTTFKNLLLNEGFEDRNVTALKCFPKFNSVYVGSEAGLTVIKNDSVIRKIPLPEFSSTIINSINPYKDSLLMLGSGGSGIMFIDPVSFKRKIISTADGLPSDFIYFVAADSDNIVWVGTEQGITRLKLNARLGIEQNLHYGYENGLEGVETNRNAFLLDGEKYFGLIDGVYRYNELPREGWSSFPLHLRDIEILYGQYSSRAYSDSLAGFFRVPYRPKFPADRNHITFQFNQVDKRYPSSVRFKYFLENFDKTWSQPSSVGSATYSNLPPGEYVFNVVATNNQGSWDRQPLRYAFTVKAPFYQTEIFQVAMVLMLAGLIVLVFYLRVRKKINKIMEVERIRQQEQESLRKEIARDFHDEMGNQLTRIINYVSLMKLNNGNAVALYDKVEESAKYLYTGARDFIWSIDPGNDELSKLFLHIRDFGEKLFEEKGMMYRALNSVAKNVRVPYGFSREANLIFKEAMTNAFNHSGAKNVTFTLKIVDDAFEMKLADDGKGFDKGALAKMNGLKNMKARAERIGGILYIQSRAGAGTEISLILPIHIFKGKI